MTETEWTTSTNFRTMIRFLDAMTRCTTRKLRLAGCGVFRLVRSNVFTQQEAPLLELGEAFSDDPIHAAEVARYKPDDVPASFPFDTCYPSKFESYGSESVVRVVDFMEDRLGDVWWEQHPGVSDEDEAHISAGRAFRKQAEVTGVWVLRDIFGNPFRPSAFAPGWRTSTVVWLAQSMYESRDFSAMPILADALQDAGCADENVLSHCRGPGPHVRGCWVCDLVLGKE